MKKLLALLMAVAVTFQLVTPVFADTEGTEETTAPTETVVETEAPTEAPAEETTAPTEETAAPTEETSASTEATEETEEAAEETVEDIALFADNADVIASGVCGENGDNLTWVLTVDGALTISGSGEMEDYSSERLDGKYRTTAPWGAYSEQITAVVLEHDVTSIGDYAFSRCRLTSVMIPDGVISIGSDAFNWCSRLTSVTIPDGVTDISRGAFFYCSSLTSVTIPDSVTSIGGYAFCGCGSLASVTIPESVTSIGGDAFGGCGNLTSVTIPESVTSIGDSAFTYCSKLENVYYGGDDQRWKKIEIGVNNNDLTNATIHYAFSHIHDMVKTEAVEPTYWSVGNNAYYTCFCGKVFKDANGETETTVEDETLAMLPSVAHGTCGDKGDNLGWVLTEDGTLTISGEGEMENYSAKELDGKYCTTASWGVYREQITLVVLEPGVTGIGEYAFRGCSSLTSVTISEGATSIGLEAFCDCGSLTSVTIPDGVTSIGDRAFYGCSNLTSVTIPESVTSIGSSAFLGCRSLTSVKIPEGVASIDDQVFRDCSSLASVTVPESITSIGNYAFLGCNSLTSVMIPDGVTSIGDSAFQDCSSLTSVTIPGSVTSIGEYAFNYCSSLTSVTIPEGVTSIGDGAFWDCSSLTSVTIPEGVTSIGGSAFRGCSSLTGMTIPDGVTSIGYGTFQDCSNLVSVKIPESLASIGHCAFRGCSSLTSVTIPDSVTSIGDAAFEACSGLTGVTIPDGVTSIGEKDFSCCISLTSVAIPESVTSIGDSAFDNCSKLKHVYYGGPDLQWAKIEIGVNNDALVNAIIHYGSSHIHNTEHIHEKAVSCTEAGNLEYWLCSICGKYFTDETFTKSTDEAGVTLPALGHAMTRKKAVKPTHKTAGNIEYYICSRCGKLFKDALGEEETTLEEVTLPVIPYVSKIVLTRDGEPVPETMEVGGRTGDTLTFAAVVQPEGAETKVKWSSGTPAVAQVDQDGVVTLLTSGTTVIKAAATDGSKVTAQVTLNVIARDYAPRLGDSTLTLNSASSAGVSVDLVESYGNQILSVSVDDERFDVEYADNLLTLTSREAVARGTYRMTLEAVCDDGRTYSYPITVRVIQTLPRLTVRQSQRFNLFYRDSQAALTITGGEVESAELIGNSDFVLENEGGEWVIRYADPENAPAKPSTRATLSVSFAGYNIPVTRALTIGTVNTAPKLKLNPTSSTLNTALNSDWSVETVLSGADGESLYAYTDTPGVDVALSGNVLTLTLTEAKNVSANVYVQDDNWTKPVKLTHRVTVTNRLPTLRAAAGTLKLNSWFPSETASTGMILSQGNVSLTDVELTPAAREGTAARAESDKLNVYYDADSGEIVAEIADPGIKNGTYSFACTGILESGTEISGGTVRVTVSNTLPRARLSAAMVRLNRRLAGEESIAVKVTLTGGDGYAIEGFEELPDCLDYADGILTATIPNADFTGGSYVLNAIVSRNGETATLPAGVILRVQVYDRAPSFRLTAKGKLDVLNPASEIIYTPRLTNAQGTVTDIRLKGADAELFAAEVADGVVHLTMAKGCTYSTRTTYRVTPVLTFCGQEVTGSTLSIRVTQSTVKLAKLSNRTVYQSQTAPLVQVLSITSPATAEFGEITLNSRSTAALRNAMEAAGGIEVSGGVVRFPAKAFASLKPGRYTVILDVTPENAAADAKPIQARFTLTVQK